MTKERTMHVRKKLKLGTMIHGIGEKFSDWRHSTMHSVESINFEFYKQQAQTPERGKFDFAFIADALYINEKSNPHYLNRFEPLKILSVMTAMTAELEMTA
ncbi:hypothetical protein [Sporosarcina sp. P20a]|uniref:hypothetical protein n=1 Tax=Sporosarcina sp. P20a TaxID=2048256 RepID=UPI001E5739AD|nr:hypothetical protein [Sporosarcina sp. P20a]